MGTKRKAKEPDTTQAECDDLTDRADKIAHSFHNVLAAAGVQGPTLSLVSMQLMTYACEQSTDPRGLFKILTKMVKKNIEPKVTYKRKAKKK